MTRSSIDSPREDDRSQYKHRGVPQRCSWRPLKHDPKLIPFATSIPHSSEPQPSNPNLLQTTFKWREQAIWIKALRLRFSLEINSFQIYVSELSISQTSKSHKPYSLCNQNEITNFNIENQKSKSQALFFVHSIAVMHTLWIWWLFPIGDRKSRLTNPKRKYIVIFENIAYQM